MDNFSSGKIQTTIWHLSMLLAPLLLLISQFFWTNGVLTIQAGWLQVLAFTFWIPAFQAMYDSMKTQWPRYAAIGFLVAAYACIGGNNFGVDGIYGEATGVFDVAAKNVLHQKLGIGGMVALYLPGILFPLSLISVGVGFIRTKKIDAWVAAMLIIAAIGFPLSRIPREPLIAHADNILLLVSHFIIAQRILRAQKG